MRQVHHGGEKLFVDYSGKKPSIINPVTGEVIEVELFVAVLGASNYTYAEATRTQASPDWIASHVRTLEHIGGVPGAIVPDQLKSGVIKACRYEPTTQRTYHELARHYGTAIMPARPGKPRDKAKVEVGVQVVQRWILARLRNEQFFSLEALNERIGELAVELNARPMRRYGDVTRRELFERLDLIPTIDKYCYFLIQLRCDPAWKGDPKTFDVFYELVKKVLVPCVGPAPQREVIGESDILECAFCGRGEPHVSFRDDAHTVPAGFGTAITSRVKSATRAITNTTSSMKLLRTISRSNASWSVSASEKVRPS